jgi:hypothetical protein
MIGTLMTEPSKAALAEADRLFFIETDSPSFKEAWHIALARRLDLCDEVARKLCELCGRYGGQVAEDALKSIMLPDEPDPLKLILDEVDEVVNRIPDTPQGRVKFANELRAKLLEAGWRPPA